MIAILLPAYNEEESLPALLPKIDQAMGEGGFAYRLIIGNDGSSDQTARLLEEAQLRYPIEVLTHRRNRGLGETVRDLFERAAEVCAVNDVIVRMDCDDTHEPKYIVDMVRKLDEGADVVTASRFQQGGGQRGVVGHRALLSSCANLFMRTVFPIRNVREYSCGFRAYRAGLIKTALDVYGNNFIQLKGLGFTCTLEKLIKLNLLGARFAEVPFVLRYDNKRSSSKMPSRITTLGYLVMAICYHWPWGGWSSQRRGRRAQVALLNRSQAATEKSAA
ncbi:MAG: glycosyltransferase [Gemmataceae bacterium]